MNAAFHGQKFDLHRTSVRVASPESETGRSVGSAGHSRYVFCSWCGDKIPNEDLGDRCCGELARSLWIVPVSLITAAYMARRRKPSGHIQHHSKITIPWFIFLFIGAPVFSTYVPRFLEEYLDLNKLGKAGLTATLFLIGTSLSKKTLHEVGIKPFLQGVILWIIVGTTSLVPVYTDRISI